MSDEKGWRYRAALLASTISVLGWIGVLVGTAYTMYAVVVGGPVGDAAMWTGAAALVGMGFAKAESTLYDTDESALERLREGPAK